MKRTALLLSCIGLVQMASAQLTLSGTSYTQNFNSLASGLPTGWSIDSGATATSLGTSISSNFVATAGSTTAWAYTSGNFRNVASANGFTNYAAGTTTLQTAATDRALAVRQVAPTSTTFPGTDPGAAFELNIANTTGLTNFTLSFKLQSLDSTCVRVTTWTVDYGFGVAPTSFTPATAVGTVTTGGNTFSNNTVTVNFGSALNNHTGPLWIRIATLAATTGSGSRPTTGIDDFTLNWSGAGATNYKPIVTAVTPANGTTNVAVGTNLTVTFDRNVTGTATGNIRIKNETDQTTQTKAGNSADVAISGKTATISNVTLALGKVYHVTFDSTAFDTASYNSYGIYDTTAWKFTMAPVPVGTLTALNETFDAACAANGIPNGWMQYSVTGPSQTWRCSGATTAPNYYVTMNGFASSANNINEDWLITPKLNFSAMTNPMVVFNSRYRFAGANITVIASNNYTGAGDPNLATWSPLPASFPPVDSNVWQTQGLTFTAYKSSPLYIAFKYTSTATDGRQWDVDSVSVMDMPGPSGVAGVAGSNTLPVSVLGQATNNQLVVAYVLEKAGMINATVTDITGRRVYSGNFNAVKGNNQVTLAPQTLQQGMYIIRISNGTEQGVARTFVQ